MKKIVSYVLALMLMLCAMPAVLAEEAVLLWEADYIAELKGVTYAVKTTDGRLDGIVGLDGEVLVQPDEYAYLQSVNSDMAHDYFAMAKTDSLNNLTVIDRAGNVISTATYGDVKAISDQWLICAILSETWSSDYDFSSIVGNQKYVALRYDLYYLPTASCVGQLSREQYNRAKDIGDYLLVQDDAGVVCVYDTSFQLVETHKPFKYMFDSEFMIAQNGKTYDAVVSRITGETIATGYTYVSDCSDELLCVGANNRYGLMDHQGNLVLPAEYDHIVYTANLGVYKLRLGELFAIYDPANGAMLPCAYTDILARNVMDGTTYYCIEIDGKVGYVNQHGEVTSAIEHDKSAVTVLGCSMFKKDETGAIVLIAADGTVITLEGVTEARSLPDATEGRCIRVKNAAEEWGIMNWHGKLVFDFSRSYASAFEFIDETHFILDSKYMYELQ